MLLRLDRVCKSYGSLVVSDNVSLEIAEHELFALIGPNGAGKSTLLAEIAGELAADRGDILFNGVSIAREGADARARRGIARTFQVSALFDEFSLEDNVAIAVRGRDALHIDLWRDARGNADVRERARTYLERVNLASRASEYPSALSHGERRQLEIAMALATQPALLLLDEPMAGLGARETADMIDTLAALKGHLAMLLVEHDMSAVERLADRVGVLVSGAIVACAPFAQIRDDARVREAYLGEHA